MTLHQKALKALFHTPLQFNYCIIDQRRWNYCVFYKGRNESIRKTRKLMTIHGGCRAGAVVRSPASHPCGLGLIPRSCVKCGLTLLVLYSAHALRGFLWNSDFPSPQKPKFALIVLLISVTMSPISAPAVERPET